MKRLLIINTGGTFNKQYNPIDGTLDVVQDSAIINDLMSKWLCEFEVLNIIGKDSLQMNTQDRMELLARINMGDHDDVVVIHGTDTMDITAEYLADAELDKRIVLTGAMVPYSINPVEATANLASAIGYIQLMEDEGVHIVINGAMGRWDKVKKDKKKGKFILV